MGFLVNELSMHGQFADLTTFKAAIERLMKIRKVVCAHDRELYCHKNLAHADVMPNMTMPQAVAALPVNERRVLMTWLTQNGPFWQDQRQHSPSDYLECRGQVVTDCAIGEAAWCCANQIERTLISITPSDWTYTPIVVNEISDAGKVNAIEVNNHWDAAALAAILALAPRPLGSWSQLAQQSVAQLTNLRFASDAFAPLDGHPFVPGAARQMRAVLQILNRYKACFDEKGQRTVEGNTIYQDFFTGKKEGGGHGAMFSDSSDSEKSEFSKELTFNHPDDSIKTLFCPWHGKVQTPQLRVHFSYPISAKEPLYIVYVGPKLTKR